MLNTGKNAPTEYEIVSTKPSFANDNRKNNPIINTFNKAVKLDSLYCKGRLLNCNIVMIESISTKQFNTIGKQILELTIPLVNKGNKVTVQIVFGSDDMERKGTKSITMLIIKTATKKRVCLRCIMGQKYVFQLT